MIVLFACTPSATTTDPIVTPSTTGDTATVGVPADTGHTGTTTPGLAAATFTLGPCSDYGTVDEISAQVEVTVDGAVVHSALVTTCGFRLEELPPGHLVARASAGDWWETYYVTGSGIYESWGGSGCSGEVEADLGDGDDVTLVVPFTTCTG